MNFIKTFLAAILAFVVGSFLVFFLWIFILLGIAGSMEKTVAVHAESILKIDFSDVLTDAPSSDPFAGIDFATLRSTRQLPLMKALRALEAAKDDSRIKGIYLRMNGNGGVMARPCWKSCAKRSSISSRAANSSSLTTRPIRRGNITSLRRPTKSTCSPKAPWTGRVSRST